MAERPILFSAPMVKALLAGRKTQTRRANGLAAVDPRGDFIEMRRGDDGKWRAAFDVRDEAGPLEIVCPYGGPGDRLWVRETWAPLGKNDPSGKRVVYAAGPFLRGSSDPKVGVTWPPPKNSCDAVRVARWRPSIHMPRWASRLMLEVTGVRVERLQAISEEDAKAEGCCGFDPEPVAEGGTVYAWKGRSSAPDPRAHFRHLWESIHGADSWESNPWVWRLEFRRLP